MSDGPLLSVTLVLSPAPREVQEHRCQLPTGTTVGEALVRSGQLERWQAWLQGAEFQVSVWGRAAATDQILQEGDRIEWCRPLRVDPKVARRERFQRQGVRRAGLFARRGVNAPTTPNGTV